MATMWPATKACLFKASRCKAFVIFPLKNDYWLAVVQFEVLHNDRSLELKICSPNIAPLGTYVRYVQRARNISFLSYTLYYLR